VRRGATAIWALCALAGPLASCFSVTGQARGLRIGDETLRQFKAGVTTEAWLLAVLGPPTRAAPVDGLPNTKVFRYTFIIEQSGSIVSKVAGTGGESPNDSVYFIITDGVVTRFWTDRADSHDDSGGIVGSIIK